MKITKDVKTNFPIFKYNPGLIYLDNSATSQKPKAVLTAITNFYQKSNANISRGSYPLAAEAEWMYNKAKLKISSYFGTKEDEIIVTAGCTHSVNLLSQMIKNSGWVNQNHEIIVTQMEHHANFLPWKNLAKQTGAKLVIWPIQKNGRLDLDWLKNNLNQNTALVAVTHICNSTGVINPIQKIAKIIQKAIQKTPQKPLLCVDGAQAAAHHQINFEEIGADFYYFSAHKMYGPTGVGVLLGKSDLLQKMTPAEFGGGAIKTVSLEEFSLLDSPACFEPGTPKIAELIGLEASVIWLEKIKFNLKIDPENFITEITKYAVKKLEEIEEISIPIKPDFSSGIVSFLPNNQTKIHPLDLGIRLGLKQICIRTGSHCTQPLMQKLGYTQGTCRASFGLYNTFEDVDILAESIKEILKKAKAVQG